MKDYFCRVLNKPVSLFDCFAKSTTMLHPYKQVMTMNFGECICTYSGPSFLPISKDLFDKLTSFKINTYEDFINYPIKDLKTNFTKEEIISLFARALPILDNFLEDDELRKYAAISTCYTIKQYSIGLLLTYLFIDDKDPKELASKFVDKDCMLFLYFQLFHYLNPKNSMLTSDYRLVFIWLYESLDETTKKELAKYKQLYDIFDNEKVIYPELFIKNFVISKGDIDNYADYLNEGRKQLKKLQKGANSNYMAIEKVNEQYKREVAFISNLFANQILSESDIKAILGPKDSKRIIAFEKAKENL